MKVANKMQGKRLNASMNIRQFLKKKKILLNNAFVIHFGKKVVYRKTGMSSTIVFNFQSLNFKGAIHGIAENVSGSIHTLP